jgi:hypothetical protein
MTIGVTKTNKSLLRAVVVGAGLLGFTPLTGCATLYPSLQEINIDNSLATPAERSRDLLETSAVALQTNYADGFNQSSKIVDISALPILGAAAAAAGLLLFDGSTQALKAVALGVGTYTAGRLLFSPQGTPELYMNAHRAVSCVKAEGSALTRDAGQLDTQAQDLAYQIVLAQAVLVRRAPAGTDPATLEDARSNLRAEITNANEALAKAGAAKGAYEAGPQTIVNALQDIQTRTVQKMREGRSISFPSAVAAITATYQELGLPEGEELDIAASADIEDIQEQTNQLARKRQQLEANTPPYVQARENVGKCPERI